MKNWKNGKCAVYEDRFGNTRCGACMDALFCDENGDMPDECPRCGAPLDYSLYDPVKYQILMLKDDDKTVDKRFMRYDWAMAHGGVNMDEYEVVYTGKIGPGDSATGMLEAIYAIFNTNHPKDYAGRSLSVSDLVTLDGIGTYFCDSVGFRRLDDQLTIFDR